MVFQSSHSYTQTNRTKYSRRGSSLETAFFQNKYSKSHGSGNTRTVNIERCSRSSFEKCCTTGRVFFFTGAGIHRGMLRWQHAVCLTVADCCDRGRTASKPAAVPRLSTPGCCGHIQGIQDGLFRLCFVGTEAWQKERRRTGSHMCPGSPIC